MFRDMRRKKQLLFGEAAEQVLADGKAGVLAVMGDEDYPYAVPVNYVYVDGKIYFHSAVTGHKLDGIRRSDKVSFCVIDRDEVIPEKLTSAYRSVIAFGRARLITDDEEKRSVLRLLTRKYSPGFESQGEVEIERDWNITAIVAISVEHLTGKVGLELLKG